MAKAKPQVEEVVVEEVVNETPVWQGHPSRDLKAEGMIWDSRLGTHVWPTKEVPAEEAPVEEAAEEAPVEETPAE